MLKFEDFFKVSHPDDTKVKFNMNAGNRNLPAWDYLMNGEEDPDWIALNAHKAKHGSNNNLNHCHYLLAFAQYYP